MELAGIGLPFTIGNVIQKEISFIMEVCQLNKTFKQRSEILLLI